MQMSHLMLPKLWTVFLFQQLIIYSWVSSFSWSAFSLAARHMSFAFARSGS